MTRDFYGHVVPAHERLMQILAALEPVAQPETPTPGQFTTMCLAIEDVITGRGFDVAIPEEVKAYLRNALMVGGWRGES